MALAVTAPRLPRFRDLFRRRVPVLDLRPTGRLSPEALAFMIDAAWWRGEAEVARREVVEAQAVIDDLHAALGERDAMIDSLSEEVEDLQIAAASDADGRHLELLRTILDTDRDTVVALEEAVTVAIGPKVAS